VGCKAKVLVKGGEVLRVENIECPRGEEYMLEEVRNPVRDLFAVVRIENTGVPVLPVRSSKPVPKEMLAKCIAELARIRVRAPVKLGEVITKNFLGLDVDIVATRCLESGQAVARKRQGR
jgi:CxxC motif-containing protein